MGYSSLLNLAGQGLIFGQGMVGAKENQTSLQVMMGKVRDIQFLMRMGIELERSPFFVSYIFKAIGLFQTYIIVTKWTS